MLNYTTTKKLYEAIHEKNGLVHEVDTQASFTPYNDKKGTPTWMLWNELLRGQIGCFKDDDTIVCWNPYVPVILLEDFNVKSQNITLLGLPGEDTKKNLANQLGINYTEINQRNLIMMKNSFDYCIKNSPWDRNIRIPGVTAEFGTYPYHAFGQIGHDLVKDGGLVIDILPSNWFGVDSHKEYRQWLLKNFDILELRVVNNSDQQVFDLSTNKDVIIMIARKNSKPDNSKVRYRYHDEQVFDLDLKYVDDRYGQWPLFKGKIGFDILEQTFSHSSRPADENGRRTSKYYVEAEIKVHDRDKPDPARNWTMNQPNGNKDPIRIHYKSGADTKDHFDWYHTDHFAYIFSSIKAHPKNVSNYVKLTGYHKFDKDKNGNIDVNKTFKVSQTQQDHIKKWILSR